MKVLFFSGFLLFFSVSIFAQTDDILNKESKSDKIEKARKLLLDAVIESNLTEIEELRNYLLDLEDQNYAVLYLGEKWLLNFWLTDYEKILKDVEDFDASLSEPGGVQVYPDEDFLFAKLQEQSYMKKELLIAQIEVADLSEEEMDFLIIHFSNLLQSRTSFSITQDLLNSKTNLFLEKYENSKYEDYLRKFVRYEFEPSDWGFSFEFFSGYGIFTGNLSNDFTNSIPMGIAFDVFYKNYVLFLRNYIGLHRTKMPIQFQDGTWRDDSQARFFLPEASIGYLLLNSESFRAMPFVGIAASSISPTEHDKDRIEEYDNVGIDFKTTYTFGLNADILFPTGRTRMISSNEESNFFLRIRYSYNIPQFEDRFSGNFHSITVGVGGFGRSLKRAY